MNSILTSVKKIMPITEECEDFDADLIMHINTVFRILFDLGVGEKPFFITDKTATWEDYLGEEYDNLRFIESYVCLKTKLIFDPPTGGVLESYNNMIKELEFRINVAVDTGEIEKYFTKNDVKALENQIDKLDALIGEMEGDENGLS